MLYSCVWKDDVPETNLFYWLYLQNNMQDPLFHLESEDFLCEWLLCCAFAFFACFLELVYVIQLFLSAFFRFVVKYFHVVSEVGEKTWTLNCSNFSSVHSYWMNTLIAVLFRYQKWNWRHLEVVLMLNLEHHRCLAEVLLQHPVPSGKSLFKFEFLEIRTGKLT